MTRIEFRLLGPLEVRLDGQPIAVRGGKPRSLLAVLLLHAGEVISTDRLIEALWDERPPSTAANALQAHVAALRRALEPERAVLITRPPGYLLEIDNADLDTARFESLVSDGHAALPDDPLRAAGLLREALALWRGPALADFAYESFAQGEAARLEEMRLAALEDRLEADLALGHHAEVVPELEKLLAEHPLRERPAGQLMMALYRCGRQADASEVFQSTRRALVEKLGMEPGPALRQLLQQVLGQDPNLELTGPRTAGATATSGPERHPRHNLPIELTSFVGREQELAEICALLERGRLVTLTGAGGSGKTRLALRAARQALERYPDGVWLVELAPLSDPALVASAVVASAGIRAQAGTLIAALKRSLSDSRVLIVLDNCEHLVDACAELAYELLSSCERVRIVATSRQPLGIASEVAWPVPGLELPSDTGAASVNEVGQCAAVQLFVERACAARPTFTLDSGVAATVADICRRLDGIPLAIELAAARTRALTPCDILGRLDDRFSLLTGGTRDALPRHRALQATIDWSHDLLSEGERVLFRRLSVFAGGCTLSDAERVCAHDTLPAADLLDVLSDLVAKSLVSAEPSLTGATRYGMLETLRAYADEQLRASGERETIRRHHFDHFLEVAEEARERRESTGLNAELDVILASQDNIRAALDFARTEDANGMLRLAGCVEQLWLAGNVTEGRRRLEEALAMAPDPSRERIRALNSSAGLALLQQDHEEGRRLIDGSIALANELRDSSGEAWAWLWLGFLELNADPPTPNAARRSVEMHEQTGDRIGICRSLVFAGGALAQDRNTIKEGLEALHRALAIAQELEDVWAEGFARVFLGWTEIALGNHDAAATHLARAVGTPALGPVRGTAIEALARLSLADDPRRAARLVGACASVRERGGGVPPRWLKRRGEQVRGEAEQILGPAEALQAWDEGRRMRTEQAIAYALNQDVRKPHSRADGSRRIPPAE
jgi:predicted ATPase/DNA-binding SARP family transcriptional activator